MAGDGVMGWIDDATENAAAGLGQVLGAVIEGVVNAIIPVIEEVLPAIVRSIGAAFEAVKEGVEGSEADIITVFTVVIIMMGAFITGRGILARGTMIGARPPPISVPVVGPV